MFKQLKILKIWMESCDGDKLFSYCFSYNKIKQNVINKMEE